MTSKECIRITSILEVQHCSDIEISRNSNHRTKVNFDLNVEFHMEQRKHLYPPPTEEHVVEMLVLQDSCKVYSPGD